MKAPLADPIVDRLGRELLLDVRGLAHAQHRVDLAAVRAEAEVAKQVAGAQVLVAWRLRRHRRGEQQKDDGQPELHAPEIYHRGTQSVSAFLRGLRGQFTVIRRVTTGS